VRTTQHLHPSSFGGEHETFETHRRNVDKCPKSIKQLICYVGIPDTHNYVPPHGACDELPQAEQSFISQPYHRKRINDHLPPPSRLPVRPSSAAQGINTCSNSYWGRTW